MTFDQNVILLFCNFLKQSCLFPDLKNPNVSRFTVLFGFLLLTGIGSWMFHMTLLYEMQLMDEIPMVWGSAYMVFCLYQVKILREKMMLL
jgi:hypothetical protein